MLARSASAQSASLALLSTFRVWPVMPGLGREGGGEGEEEGGFGAASVIGGGALEADMAVLMEMMEGRGS